MSTNTTEKQQIDVTEFCRREAITIRSAERVDSNPNMERADMDHWKVQLEIRSPRERRGRRMTVFFSMGYGHNGKQPDADEVLNALASDYTEENASFEDWCGELGYDTDSRKAERTFKACQKQTAMLEHFLGAELTKELIYEVERL